MDEEEIIAAVCFAILMENNGGILEKSPDYIEEKYLTCESIKLAKVIHTGSRENLIDFIKLSQQIRGLTGLSQYSEIRTMEKIMESQIELYDASKEKK